MVHRRKRTELEIGAVVDLTEGDTAVIGALVLLANTVTLSKEARREVFVIRRECEATNGVADDSVRAEYIIERLIDILDEYCPPLSAIRRIGDTAQLGVWPDPHVLDGTETNEDIGRGDYLPWAKDVKEPYWLFVNDHGNATLYEKVNKGQGWGWRHCWSVV